MHTILDLYCRILKFLAVGMLVLMVALVFANVVLRYAFNSGIPVSEELSRWLFVWVTLLGSTYALREHSHLGTEVIVALAPPAFRRVLLLIGHALMLWVCWLLLSGAWTQVQMNWTVRAPSTGLPVALFYLSGVVFSISAALILIEQAIGILRGNNDIGPTVGGEQL